MSIINAGTDNNVQLNNEHFRRMGSVYNLIPYPIELIAFLKNQKEKNENSLLPDSAISSTLSDKDHLLKYVYSFTKANELINDKIGSAYQLGQWSSIRDSYLDKSYTEIIKAFVNHLAGLAPEINVNTSFFNSIEFAIKNEGKLKGSNPISRFFDYLEEKGFLTEFIVGLAFILISTLISFFIYRKHGRLLGKHMSAMADLLSKHEDKSMGHDAVLLEIENIKYHVDELALKRQINFEEANFFYQFFTDKKIS